MDEFNSSTPQPVALPPEPVPDNLPFTRPADYYSDPTHKLRPLFPRWVPMGCGWASLAFIVLLFVAGALAPSSGKFLDWLFGKFQTDLAGHFTKDVTPAQKATWNAEMKTLRTAASHGKLQLDKTQSFLRLATDVDADEKIDPKETDKLIAAARDVNRSVK
ncbi:MAG: hypothetical protein QOE82_3757 [Thermoanaerobaculia bacterium]|nr:hypothetical protein [Thermoanaerobaculia bacterium]